MSNSDVCPFRRCGRDSYTLRNPTKSQLHFFENQDAFKRVQFISLPFSRSSHLSFSDQLSFHCDSSREETLRERGEPEEEVG